MVFAVYIITNKRNGVLYTGHTDDLDRRMWEHREGWIDGFASKHNCRRLIWFEWHDTRESAFIRERRIKAWRRNWKMQLIERANPNWDDLYVTQIHAAPEGPLSAFNMKLKAY
jgi:putative endonuclease